MHIFTVHVRQKSSVERMSAAEKAVLVPEGFSFKAAIFQCLWFLYHRVWWMALVVIALNAVLSVLEQREFISAEFATALGFAVVLWVGFEAFDVWRMALKSNGFEEWGVVSGVDEEDARRRFLDLYLAERAT